MKCVSTSVPSMPRHMNVSYGMRFTSLQLILVVRKVSMPDFFRICGSAPAIAEHVGEPEESILVIEFFLEEFFREQDLPDERLARS